MIDRLDIIDKYSVKCDFNLTTVTFIVEALNISLLLLLLLLKRYDHVMCHDFIYLAKGFRMRPKVRSTLSCIGCHISPVPGLEILLEVNLNLMRFTVKISKVRAQTRCHMYSLVRTRTSNFIT